MQTHKCAGICTVTTYLYSIHRMPALNHHGLGPEIGRGKQECLLKC